MTAGIDTLRDHAGSSDDLFGAVWNPAEDPDQSNVLYGWAVRADLVNTKFGRMLNLDIADQDGVVWTVWLTADLRTQLHARELAAGDEVYLEYTGKEALDDGNEVKRFNVATARNGKVIAGSFGHRSPMLPEPPDDDAEPSVDAPHPAETPAPEGVPF